MRYIEELKISKRIKDYSFLKKDGIFISGKNVEIKSYIPHKDILSGYLLLEAADTKEVIEICKDCPVFKRNGDIQIKEIDQEYLKLL